MKTLSPLPPSALHQIAAALQRAAEESVGPAPELSENALFVGCGDSLSAAMLATNHGHRAVSAGDIAWGGDELPGAQTLVALSNSGATAATVEAARRAQKAGVRTIGVTPAGASPLAEACDEILLVPRLQVAETVPAAAYVALALGVLSLCGAEFGAAAAEAAAALEAFIAPALRFGEDLPQYPCQGLSVLTLPDLRSAGDFWTLKLIEATGLPTRSVPLEECGHVDYFIGPQSHLVLQLIGHQGRHRHEVLAETLRRNGHLVVSLDVMSLEEGMEASLPSEPRRPSSANDVLTVAVGALGASVALGLASSWGRTPFRGGAVDMSAAHIQVQ